MKKPLKIFAFIIVLLIAVALIAPSFISTDMVKRELTAQVEASTGRTLTIGGDLKVRFFPVVGVTADDVSFSGLSKDKPLARLKSLDVNVQAVPLLSGDVVVKTLHLNDPEITMEVTSDGRQNWVFETKHVDTAEAKEAKKSGAPVPVRGISLADVKIKNGTVHYRNAQSGDAWEVKNLDVAVSMDALGKPLKFKSTANVQGKDVAISGNMTCKKTQCEFADAAFAYDKLNATGAIGVDYGKAVPYVIVNLKTDELDLNPFLPQPVQKSASGFELISRAFAAEGWSRAPMDFSGLRAVNAAIVVEAKHILAQKIKIDNTTLKAKLNGGRLSAEVKDADIYGGKGGFTVTLDSISAQLEKTLSLKGVAAEPFLKDAMDEDHLSGTAEMNIAVAGRGRSQYEIINSLQGQGALKFTDGAIKGINLADMVRNVKSAFTAVDGAAQKTDFAELGGTFTITNGVVKNTDLAMKAPLLRLTGAGQVDLPQRTVNYRLKPEIVQSLKGQGGKDKEGLGVPVIVEGSLDNPHFRPDLESVVQDAIKNPEKAKETVKNIKEQFNKENRKETLENLKGMFR